MLVYTGVYIYICICMYTCIYVYIYVYMYVCIYVYMYICVYRDMRGARRKQASVYTYMQTSAQKNVAESLCIIVAPSLYAGLYSVV